MNTCDILDSCSLAGELATIFSLSNEVLSPFSTKSSRRSCDRCGGQQPFSALAEQSLPLHSRLRFTTPPPLIATAGAAVKGRADGSIITSPLIDAVNPLAEYSIDWESSSSSSTLLPPDDERADIFLRRGFSFSPRPCDSPSSMLSWSQPLPLPFTMLADDIEMAVAEPPFVPLIPLVAAGLELPFSCKLPPSPELFCSSVEAASRLTMKCTNLKYTKKV